MVFLKGERAFAEAVAEPTRESFKVAHATGAGGASADALLRPVDCAQVHAYTLAL